jgi:hypothetical protein
MNAREYSINPEIISVHAAIKRIPPAANLECPIKCNFWCGC